MTDDRSRRFEADLAAVLHETAGPGAPASLRYRLANVTGEPSLVRHAWFAPLRWAAAAVAVVALVVLTAPFLAHEIAGPVPTGSTSPSATVPASASVTPSGEPSPTASPSVSPTSSPSATPSPTPSPTLGPIGWSSLTWSKGIGMADGQFVSDLVVWGDGYVGVGGIDTGSGIDAGFFTSADGNSWKLMVREAPESDGLAGMLAAHVVRIGNRLLAVGSAVMNGPGERPDIPAPLWVSDDGVTWTRVHSAAWDAAFVSRWPARLIAGPQGAVALTLGADPVVLFSADGSTWTQAPLPVIERAVVNDALGYAGGFVIVGRDGQPDVLTEVCENSCPPPGVGRPAAWISADGLHWSEATVQGDKVAGAGLSRVVAGRTGLVAVGVKSTADYYEPRMTSWTSEDGRSWSIASGLQLPSGTGTYPVLAGDGERAVVFGSGSDGAGLAAWATSDNVTWTRLAFEAPDNAPATNCGGSETCIRVQQAWVVPDGVIVMGTPGPVTPQTFWLATPGS